MLDESMWESTLATVHGVVYRGTERIGTAQLLDLLQFGESLEDRRRIGKRLVTIMRSLGWTGPKAMRLDYGKSGSGYWRLPCRPPGGNIQRDADLTSALSEELPEALEQVTRRGLRKLYRILNLPTNAKDGNLLRAQVTAAGIAINGQLRADEQRLRAKVTGDVLERLLAAIERERRKDREAIEGKED